MPVRGRLRFEVLRRDNHACRYCGAKAPEAQLTIDHVVPQALGGKDDPTNLVTACRSCNAGKAASNADETMVADVDQRAMLWNRAITIANQVRVEHREEIDELCTWFATEWDGWGYNKADGTREQVPRTEDWRITVRTWIEAGLDIEELIEQIPRAILNTKRRKVPIDEKWTYFCGIGWGMLTELQEQARVIADNLYQEAQEADQDPFYGLDESDVVAYWCGDQFIEIIVLDEAA